MVAHEYLLDTSRHHTSSGFLCLAAQHDRLRAAI